jgi:hypothetical protein
MSDHRFTTVIETGIDDPSSELRQLGARAHQLRATTRAADHYIALDAPDAANTASWLMSASLDLSAELVTGIDGLARTLKEQPGAGLGSAVAKLRVLVHQLHAAAKAADHFLDQDGGDLRETGVWLIATASGLAAKLACGLDDAVASARTPFDKTRSDPATIEAHDPQFARRVAAATATPRAA